LEVGKTLRGYEALEPLHKLLWSMEGKPEEILPLLLMLSQSLRWWIERYPPSNQNEFRDAVEQMSSVIRGSMGVDQRVSKEGSGGSI